MCDAVFIVIVKHIRSPRAHFYSPTTETDSDEMEFACKAETQDGAEMEIEDEIEYKIQVSYKGVGVSVEYKQEIESEEMEQETETQFEIWFDRIIEYSKGSEDYENEAYDWEADTVVKTLYLLEWNEFSEVTTDESGVVSHFSVSTLQGVATFDFTISRADYDEHITANNIKIDFLLNDLSWKERDDTYVALISKVESQREVELEHDGDHAVESVMPKNAVVSFQEVTSVMGAVPFGEFTWEESAQAKSEAVNGTVTVATEVERAAELTSTIQVVATSPPIVSDRLPGDKSSEFIAFSFVGDAARSASEIYWDPEAGVGYGAGTSGVAALATSLSVFCVVIGAILFVVY